MKNFSFVLHVGTEKTGTTAIQRFLGTRSGLLRAQKVLPAGDSFCLGVFNNLHLAFAAAPTLGSDLDRQRAFSFPEYQARVREHIESLGAAAIELGCNKVVFSSEHLSSRLVLPENLAALRSLFPAGAVLEIVLYVRRQLDLYLGAQAEAIKQGQTQLSFSDPRLNRDGRYGMRYYDYEVLLSLWEAAFPDARIVVRPYDRADLVRQDVVADFLNVLGVAGDVGSGGSEDRPNRRLSPEALVFLASINEHINPATRWSIVNRLESIDPYSPGTFIDPEVIADFESSFSASNASIASRYLQRSELFATPPAQVRAIDITNPQLKLRVIGEYTARLLESLLPHDMR